MTDGGDSVVTESGQGDAAAPSPAASAAGEALEEPAGSAEWDLVSEPTGAAASHTVVTQGTQTEDCAEEPPAAGEREAAEEEIRLELRERAEEAGRQAALKLRGSAGRVAATPRLRGSEAVRTRYVLIRGISGEKGVFHGEWKGFREYVCVGRAPHNRAIFHGFHYEAEARIYWQQVYPDENWSELRSRA